MGTSDRCAHVGARRGLTSGPKKGNPMRKMWRDPLARQERLASKKPGAHQRRVEWKVYETKMKEREEERYYALESVVCAMEWADEEEADESQS